jgi:hypothetical protein
MLCLVVILMISPLQFDAELFTIYEVVVDSDDNRPVVSHRPKAIAPITIEG